MCVLQTKVDNVVLTTWSLSKGWGDRNRRWRKFLDDKKINQLIIFVDKHWFKSILITIMQLSRYEFINYNTLKKIFKAMYFTWNIVIKTQLSWLTPTENKKYIHEKNIQVIIKTIKVNSPFLNILTRIECLHVQIWFIEH